MTTNVNIGPNGPNGHRARWARAHDYQGPQFVSRLIGQMELEPKLEKRIKAGLHTVDENSAACPSTANSTIDQRLLTKLRKQAEAMSPAMACLR